MNTFKIFYLLILTSLFGCNTLVTQPSDVTKLDKVVPLTEAKSHRITTIDRFDSNKKELFNNNQNSPTTFYWKSESSKPATKPIVKKVTHKRVKKTYLTTRNYTAKKKLANKTPTVKQAIAKAMDIVPAKKRKSNSFKGSGNLWTRVRNGYAFPAVDNHQVQKQMNKFLSNPSYFQRISRKANPYLYHIAKEVEKRGLPMELALLPAIESAFEPKAISHKSAAGLWQFMPATGRYYGLKQNKWYDGRRDIASSTNAALNYLKTLHKMFNNDWFLALAAYNYGEGNVGKAIRRNKKNNRPTDFWSLKLPRETREYVPKLLALAKIIANPKTYGIKLQKIANRPYFTEINVGRQIELSIVAQLAGMSMSDLKLLNPSYKRGVTSPRGPHNITLPKSKVHQFKQRLAQIPNDLKLIKTAAFIGKSTPKFNKIIRKLKTAKNPTTHRVKKGDTLWKIAKNYNMSIAKILGLNKLAKNSSLRVGQKLVISAKAVESVKVAKSAKIKKHKVRRGDNWWKIAKRYGTTVSLLKSLNRFKSNSLKIGKFLVIPN